MITKGIIKSIDFNGNSCIVRMPYFETAGSSEVVCEALVSNTPGVYNGYKENDVVWVAFEDGHMELPVVLGKLYLGASKEKQDPRGTINCVDSTISGTATIPNDTKLKNDLDYGQINTTIPYYSLSSLANNLQRVDIEQGQNNRDLGNKLRTVVDGIGPDGSKLYSLIEQTDARLTNEVGRKVDTDSGTKEQAFGWDLTADSWKIFARGSVAPDVEGTTKVVSIIEKVNDHNVQKTCVIINGVNSLELNEANKTTLGIINNNYSVIKSKCVQSTPNNVWEIYNSTDPSKKITTDVPANTKTVLTATTNGLEVNGNGTFTGDITASKGYIGKFIIGEEHDCTESGQKESGIYSANYIEAFEDNPENRQGVYVGTDGIKLGPNFSVDTDGKVIATSLIIQQSQVDGLDTALDDAADAGAASAVSTIDGRGYQTASQVTTITENTIQTGNLVAENLHVKAANIDGSITAKKIEVKSDSNPVLLADADNPSSTYVGGFNVTTNSLQSSASIQSPGHFCLTNEKNIYTYSAYQSASNGDYYPRSCAAKITFTKNSYQTKLFVKISSGTSSDYLIVSTKNAPSVPTSKASSYCYTSIDFNNWQDSADNNILTWVEVPLYNISAGDYVYIYSYLYKWDPDGYIAQPGRLYFAVRTSIATISSVSGYDTFSSQASLNLTAADMPMLTVANKFNIYPDGELNLNNVLRVIPNGGLGISDRVYVNSVGNITATSIALNPLPNTGARFVPLLGTSDGDWPSGDYSGRAAKYVWQFSKSLDSGWTNISAFIPSELRNHVTNVIITEESTTTSGTAMATKTGFYKNSSNNRIYVYVDQAIYAVIFVISRDSEE